MNCRCCGGSANKYGKFQNVNRIVQRYRCQRCGTTFSDIQPLDGIRTEADEAARAIGMLCEGMGVRAVSRLTGLDKKTVLRILVSAGEHCASLLDEKIQDVKAEQVQIDEIFTFVNCKPQTTNKYDETRGEFFTYLSVDRASKLIINWHTSKRDKANTLTFMRDLHRRVPQRFQLTSDAFAGYCSGNAAVQQVFGNDIDFQSCLR